MCNQVYGKCHKSNRITKMSMFLSGHDYSIKYSTN